MSQLKTGWVLTESSFVHYWSDKVPSHSVNLDAQLSYAAFGAGCVGR